jgi:hypothetical protein
MMRRFSRRAEGRNIPNGVGSIVVLGELRLSRACKEAMMLGGWLDAVAANIGVARGAWGSGREEGHEGESSGSWSFVEVVE